MEHAKSVGGGGRYLFLKYLILYGGISLPVAGIQFPNKDFSELS